MKLYLIRHGQTMANITHTYCGRKDLPITPEGEKQLEEKRLAGGYPDLKNVDLYTTGLLRTEQSFRILFGDLKHRRKTTFQEMDFGRFEGRSYYELKDEPAYQAWISGDQMKETCPGGESGDQMLARIRRGLARLLKKDRDALVVCHGGTIAMLFRDCFPDTGLNWYEIQPDNGEGYMIEFEGRKAVRWEKIPAPKNTTN